MNGRYRPGLLVLATVFVALGSVSIGLAEAPPSGWARSELIVTDALFAQPDASPTMLTGDWFDHPHDIDFEKLPRVPTDHVVISDVTEQGGVNQHNYLAHHGGRFWAMWSDGPAIEDRVGQVVKYATSEDGLRWSEPKMLTGYPPGSGPDSPHYGERSEEGYRYIARGFWVRNGELLALVSRDEAAGFFGPSLKLLVYRWDPDAGKWEQLGVIHDNAINNFPPKRLPGGAWMMSRRPHDYKRAGVEFLIGGTEAMDAWRSHPVPEGPLAAEEPFWWTLPDGGLVALFRDNQRSGYLFRAFSGNAGRTWSEPVRTNFPDARSKFHGLRMSDGRYVLVSNSHPNRRDPLTLALSEDGLVFDRLFHLVGGQRNGVDYPMVMEHEGYLYIAHSGGKGGRKQSVEVQRVRIEDLDELEMTDARPEPIEPIVMEIEGIAVRMTLHGPWGTSDLAEEKYGETYHFLEPGSKGRARFEPKLPEPGEYEVYAWWNSRGERASAVPYTVTHAEGEETVAVDQNKNGGRWVSLGRFDFDPSTAAVEITADGADGYVVAEAVRFVPRD